MTAETFDKRDLERCGNGELFEGDMRLPIDQMLMLDRISHISDDDGAYSKGCLIAELDIHPDLWFFQCHFRGDPVMPGCLGLDALWQLLGFHLAWSGGKGRGRALGAGEIKFTGQVLPTNKLVRYRLDIKRIVRRGITMGIADGTVSVDNRTIYHAKDLRVGLFTSTDNF